MLIILLDKESLHCNHINPEQVTNKSMKNKNLN